MHVSTRIIKIAFLNRRDGEGFRYKLLKFFKGVKFIFLNH